MFVTDVIFQRLDDETLNMTTTPALSAVFQNSIMIQVFQLRYLHLIKPGEKLTFKDVLDRAEKLPDDETAKILAVKIREMSKDVGDI